MNNRTFSYSKYYRPEETHCEFFCFFIFKKILDGRMDHHGLNEIFKTTEIKKGDIDQIEKKIQIFKMKEYLQKKTSNDIKEDEEIYVFRLN